MLRCSSCGREHGSLTSLIEIKREGRRLGATVTEEHLSREEFAKRQRSPAFARTAENVINVWTSSDRGGCGSEGCNCSPGLWIGVAKGPDRLLMKFNSGPELEDFTRTDYQNWLHMQSLLNVAGAT